MAGTFLLEIVTPERLFFSGEVEMVVLQTPYGEMGILKDHMPLVSVVEIGPIRILKDGEWLRAAISEGFVEIISNKVIVLCDTAEWPDEIDLERALAAELRAKERLYTQLTQKEYIRAKAALQRALSRIKVTRDYSKKHNNNSNNN
jgi:F-type H+-transporting ATPase subunit epsilon